MKKKLDLALRERTLKSTSYARIADYVRKAHMVDDREQNRPK